MYCPGEPSSDAQALEIVHVTLFGSWGQTSKVKNEKPNQDTGLMDGTQGMGRLVGKGRMKKIVQPW